MCAQSPGAMCIPVPKKPAAAKAAPRLPLFNWSTEKHCKYFLRTLQALSPHYSSMDSSRMTMVNIVLCFRVGDLEQFICTTSAPHLYQRNRLTCALQLFFCLSSLDIMNALDKIPKDRQAKIIGTCYKFTFYPVLQYMRPHAPLNHYLFISYANNIS